MSLLVCLLLLPLGCFSGDGAATGAAPRGRLDRVWWTPLLEDLHQRTFAFFWERADPTTGLVPDRWPTPSFSSIAAVGFALTAYPVGVERGWISRQQARERTLRTLRFFATAPQGPEASGTAGYRGFFYHFLRMDTGTRFADVELSSVDTALFLAGARLAARYFAADHPEEAEIRQLADHLTAQVDWQWMQPRPPRVAMGWKPETGFLVADWWGYNEAMVLYLLALGSPTYPVGPEAWQAWVSSYRWGSFFGYEHVGFGPLFGHQYSHVWVDFRGLADAYMRSKGIDYFENSRRAVLAQRAYAAANPAAWQGYSRNIWGLSACDGPADVTLPVHGQPRRFYTYAARGASHTEILDDGTLCPTAVISSIVFAPEVVIPAIEAMYRRYGAWLYGVYGFLDAYNPTFQFTDVPLGHGRVVPGVGWFDTDYLGIDQGPIVAMLENYRSELIWRLMRQDPVIRTGLVRAGFSGGWLDQP
ncbi:MAG: hypothetical protein NZ869_01130 [Thermoanaerobaculum sp.]|nr:hypothetical protein [Thermoanaerobaculum sp.]MDW7968747.1 glucoamylase family protein [Thermoanaerobaculum sp.]